jgi:hypothetical protein
MTSLGQHVGNQNCAEMSCFDTFTGGVGGWVDGLTDCSGVIIKLNSVQLQLQLPAGTELGKTICQQQSTIILLFSLGQVQVKKENSGFGPKQNTKVTFKPPPPTTNPQPTENF